MVHVSYLYTTGIHPDVFSTKLHRHLDDHSNIIGSLNIFNLREDIKMKGRWGIP